MNFITNFLRKRREEKLQFYHAKYEHYYNLYRLRKNHVILYRKTHIPTWMLYNSHLNSAKEESENYLKQYRYWRKKFKQLKKKLNSPHH